MFFASQTDLDKFGNLTISDLLINHGWKLQPETAYYMGFRGETITQNFLKNQLTQNGNCIVLNKTWEQVTAGPGNGYQIGFNIQQDHYFQSYGDFENRNEDITLQGLNLQAGLVVYIHNQDEPFHYRESINVPPGTHASISLSKHNSTIMYAPYGACDKSVYKDYSYGVFFSFMR